ncbi:hypothetical protein JOC86_002210 [Bacillus pakistanensis]|uniref:Lipoprotein n=1 Tax=Rossellomorea pakistanensis TaxID=992288 RepID=A0ABS2NCX0_9BACI|nr:hypothetical protein [Bacillus pakistanensis]MBM7585668.1 hypothetical protein [Bacillus pakistanensis]
MKKLCYVISIVFLLLVSCSNQGENKNKVEKEVVNKQTETNSPQIEALPTEVIEDDMLGFQITVVDETTSNKQNFTHNIQEGQSYTPFVQIINDHPKDTPYRIYFLLDYQLIPVTYKGQKNQYIDVTVPKSSIYRLKDIEINGIGRGLHDFIVLLVRKPETYLSKERWIPWHHEKIFRRVTVLVGEEPDSPKIKFHEIESEETEQFIGHMFLSKEPTRNLQKAKSIIKDPKEKLWLNIDIQKAPTTIAIGAIVGGEQVELTGPSSYVKATSKGVLHIPLDLSSIDYNSQKNLIVFAVANPYVRQEKDGKLKDIPLEVNLNNRVTIQGR